MPHSVRLHELAYLRDIQTAFSPEGRSEGPGTRPALGPTRMDSKVGSDRFRRLIFVELPTRRYGVSQWLWKACGRVAVDDNRDDPVCTAKLLEVLDLLGNILRLGGAWTAEDDHVPASNRSVPNRVGQIGLGRQLLFISKHGVDSIGDLVATGIGAPHQVFGYVVGLQLLMQPSGPLSTLGLVVGWGPRSNPGRRSTDVSSPEARLR